MKNPKGFSALVYLISLSVSYITSFSCFAAISLEELRTQVHGYVLNQLEKSPNIKWQIEIRGLDPRIKLQECEQGVEFKLSGKQKNIERLNTIHASCSSAQGNTLWGIYIPTQVKRMEPALLTTSNLATGHIVSKEDLAVDYLDTYSLRGNHYTQASQIIGAKIKRPMRAGQLLKSQNICLVCRGEPITIEAVGSGLFIKTDGVALADGITGGTVRVQNKRSGVKITATVIAAGRVQIKI